MSILYVLERVWVDGELDPTVKVTYKGMPRVAIALKDSGRTIVLKRTRSLSGWSAAH